MKRIIRKINLAIIILYFIIICYFALFNWAIFSVSLNIDLGFSIIQVPLLAMVFSFSLVIMLIQLGLVYINDLGHERDLAKKATDIQSFKAELHDNKFEGFDALKEKLAAIDEKLDSLLQADAKDVKDENDNDGVN